MDYTDNETLDINADLFCYIYSYFGKLQLFASSISISKFIKFCIKNCSN